MTPADITIRTATPTDADLLCTLGIKTFREAFGAYNTEANMLLYFNETFTEERIVDELQDPQTAAWFIAEHQGEAVGYAKLRTGKAPLARKDEKTIELQRIYSVKSYLGKGVGKALLQCCLEFAQSHDFDSMWLGVWEHNDHAQDFYARWGFEKFGQHVFTLGTDDQTDLLMVKKLKP
ncbi:MAG: GNAT family N-acetyltransferase [Bacteroidia bacterium]|nr:GNAT family N-acetyltransferase [Bacteroidia bacterium]